MEDLEAYRLILSILTGVIVGLLVYLGLFLRDRLAARGESVQQEEAPADEPGEGETVRMDQPPTEG